MNIDPFDKYLDHPDEEYTAVCEICGARYECSDMKLVDKWNDVWVCDLLRTDCLEEWEKQNDTKID
jgi:transcription elongation factor Elf1